MIGKMIVLNGCPVLLALLQISQAALGGNIMRVNLQGFFKEDFLLVQIINNGGNPDPTRQRFGSSIMASFRKPNASCIRPLLRH